MAPPSILIIGCGVAGPTLASFLLLADQPAAEKPRITIVERSSSLRAQGQNVDVRGAGVSIIRKLGLEGAIRAATTREAGARFVDADDRVWASFAADTSGRVQTGTSDIEILRGRMAEILFARSRAVSAEAEAQGGVGVEYLLGESVEALEQSGEQVHVRLGKSGARRSFDLVVGADGLQSRTRRLAFGEEGERDRVRELGMYAAFFSMPKAGTDSLWRRWFHAAGRRGVMLRPDDTGHRTTVLMYVITDKDRRLKDAATEGRRALEAQKGLMKEYFRDAGWESERIIREMMAADDFYYLPIEQIKMDSWSKGRVVLLGDAGYCGSPISGMGTTLALTGAHNLAGALVRHPHDHAAAFAEYDATMRPVVDRAQKLAPGTPHLINPETAWGIWLMHWIMAMISWSGVANLIARFAGPPANAVPVEDYGFRQLAEWQEEDNPSYD